MTCPTMLAGMGEAQQQLKRIFQLIAWVHAELGEPLPQMCVGRILVPLTELAEAERLLRGRRASMTAEVPGGHGRVVISFEAGSI